MCCMFYLENANLIQAVSDSDKFMYRTQSNAYFETGWKLEFQK